MTTRWFRWQRLIDHFARISSLLEVQDLIAEKRICVYLKCMANKRLNANCVQICRKSLSAKTNAFEF